MATVEKRRTAVWRIALTQVSLLERAFQIAKTGSAVTVDDVQRTLSREGYGSANQHLASPSLRKQLKALIGARQRQWRTEGAPLAVAEHMELPPVRPKPTLAR